MKNPLNRLLSLLLFLFILQPTLFAQDAVPEQFEEWITGGMEQWQIPGMAVTVVKDDEVLYTRGFGVKKLSSGEPVDEHTQFGIASVSKHMAATSLARLVDKGLISWDDKISDIIPWFKLSDSYATENVTIHDLLTHQVGVGRMLGNRLQFMTNRSVEEILYRMRYHDFEQPFRSDYVYSNMMYALAGYVVTEVTGQEWGDYLRNEFFSKMGMDRSNTSISLLDEDNAAWPHQYINGEVVEIPRRSWDNAPAAGAVNSTASDMAQWMRLQLGEAGNWNGTTLVGAEVMRDVQTPKVALSGGSAVSPQRSYGYGFSITDYNGTRLLTHGGATDGFNTIFMLVPEKNLGIMAVTNNFSSFQQAVAYTILDHHLDTEERNDWNALFLNNYNQLYERVKEERNKFEENRHTDTSPSKELRNFTGLYHNDLYDKARVFMEDGSLVMQFWSDDTLVADLEHWHYDTFRINWRNPAMREEFVTFRLGLNGYVNGMEVRYTLRPVLLQVGAYPTNYYRDVHFEKIAQ